MRGDLQIVGWRGPELVDLQRGSRILPTAVGAASVRRQNMRRIWEDAGQVTIDPIEKITDHLNAVDAIAKAAMKQADEAFQAQAAAIVQDTLDGSKPTLEMKNGELVLVVSDGEGFLVSEFSLASAVDSCEPEEIAALKAFVASL